MCVIRRLQSIKANAQIINTEKGLLALYLCVFLIFCYSLMQVLLNLSERASVLYSLGKIKKSLRKLMKPCLTGVDNRNISICGKVSEYKPKQIRVGVTRIPENPLFNKTLYKYSKKD